MVDFRPAMNAKPGIAFAVLLSACIAEVRPQQPPLDANERRIAEFDACWQGKLPPWLDDAALAAAARLDHREAQASSANDTFQGVRFSPQPPAPASGSRVAALAEERRAFQQWCALLRSGGKALP